VRLCPGTDLADFCSCKICTSHFHVGRIPQGGKEVGAVTQT